MSMRYMIWNNKGEVGKTFLTYVIATEYAIKYSEKRVTVVDVLNKSRHGEYDIYGCSTMANQTQIDAIQAQLDTLVEAL